MEEIEKCLETKHFSLELLNELREKLNNCGGLISEDLIKFNDLLFDNVRRTNVELTGQQISQLSMICLNSGYLYIKDVLFLDEVAFVVLSHDEDSEDSIVKLPLNKLRNVNGYTRCDFLDITNFFSEDGPIKQRMNLFTSLRKEIDEIFVGFYKIDTFPRRLGMDNAYMQELALKYNKEEVINGLNNDMPFEVSMICNIKDTDNIRLTELKYNPLSEELLSIIKTDTQALKLSDVLKEKEKVLIKK